MHKTASHIFRKEFMWGNRKRFLQLVQHGWPQRESWFYVMWPFASQLRQINKYNTYRFVKSETPALSHRPSVYKHSLTNEKRTHMKRREAPHTALQYTIWNWRLPRHFRLRQMARDGQRWWVTSSLSHLAELPPSSNHGSHVPWSTSNRLSTIPVHRCKDTEREPAWAHPPSNGRQKRVVPIFKFYYYLLLSCGTVSSQHFHLSFMLMKRFVYPFKVPRLC